MFNHFQSLRIKYLAILIGVVSSSILVVMWLARLLN